MDSRKQRAADDCIITLPYHVFRSFFSSACVFLRYGPAHDLRLTTITRVPDSQVAFFTQPIPIIHCDHPLFQRHTSSFVPSCPISPSANPRQPRHSLRAYIQLPYIPHNPCLIITHHYDNPYHHTTANSREARADGPHPSSSCVTISSACLPYPKNTTHRHSGELDLNASGSKSLVVRQLLLYRTVLPTPSRQRKIRNPAGKGE